MATRRLVVLMSMVGVLLLLLGTATMAQQEEEDGLYQPRDPCPQVETIVREAVKAEFPRNNQITAGLLRVFFHDCFSKGCDASILLDGEWNQPPNQNSVQPRVRGLVDEIRAKVNKVCGEKAVSCADILALATRDSVVEAKGPFVPIRRGRFDSFVAGSTGDLPSPNDAIDSILNTFGKFGLRDAADLVALSGGHTVGRTRACSFVRPVHQKCSANRPQILDIITPDEFDNQYFVGLINGQGVFNSDQNLLANARTAPIVRQFAADKQAFFRQWTTSMNKLSEINWTKPNEGEIRVDCKKPNAPRLDNIIQELVATA